VAVNRWTRRSAATSRSALAGLVVAAGLTLSACGAGQIAQTAQQRPTVDGAMADVGTLALRNVALDYPDGGFYDQGGSASLRMSITNQGTGSDTLTEVRSNVAGSVLISDSGTQPSGSASASASASASDTASASPSPSNIATGSGSPSGTGGASPSVTGTPNATGSGEPSASGTPSPTASESSAEPASAQVTIPAQGLVNFGVGNGPSVQLQDLTQKLYSAQTLQVTLVFRQAGSVTLTIAVASPQGQISLAPTVTGEASDSESEG
jgi:copper(I)-binding protein